MTQHSPRPSPAVLEWSFHCAQAVALAAIYQNLQPASRDRTTKYRLSHPPTSTNQFFPLPLTLFPRPLPSPSLPSTDWLPLTSMTSFTDWKHPFASYTFVCPSACFSVVYLSFMSFLCLSLTLPCFLHPSSTWFVFDSLVFPFLEFLRLWEFLDMHAAVFVSCASCVRVFLCPRVCHISSHHFFYFPPEPYDLFPFRSVYLYMCAMITQIVNQ